MEVRIDKWLWAVRIYKTRALATEACKKGKVTVNGLTVRSSKTVKINDLVTVTMPGIDRVYRVMQTLEKRVGAKLAHEAVLEETAPEVLERFEQIRRDPLSLIIAARPRGSGRPSKKERRDIERFTEESQDPQTESEPKD